MATDFSHGIRASTGYKPAATALKMSWRATAYVQTLLKQVDGTPLEAREKLLLFVLADYHNLEERCAWVGFDRIAREALSSRRQVIRVIKSLEKHGTLLISRHRQATGLHDSNQYFFVDMERKDGAVGFRPTFDSGSVMVTLPSVMVTPAKGAKGSVMVTPDPKDNTPPAPVVGSPASTSGGKPAQTRREAPPPLSDEAKQRRKIEARDRRERLAAAAGAGEARIGTGPQADVRVKPEALERIRRRNAE